MYWGRGGEEEGGGEGEGGRGGQLCTGGGGERERGERGRGGQLCTGEGGEEGRGGEGERGEGESAFIMEYRRPPLVYTSEVTYCTPTCVQYLYFK